MNDKNGNKIVVGATVIGFGNKYKVTCFDRKDVYGMGRNGQEFLLPYAEDLEVVSEGC